MSANQHKIGSDQIADKNQIPLFMSPRDVAAALSVNVVTIRELVKTGALPPPVRFGPKTLRFYVSDVQDFVRKAAEGGGSI